MTDRARGLLSLIAAALFWSLGGLLIKAIDLPPMAIAAGRSLIAIPVVLLFMKGGLRRPITRRQILGSFAYAGTVTLFVLATKLTTAANAILLQYTAPIWVALLSPVILREPITRIDWIAIVLVLGGMVLFFIDHLGGLALAGDLVAIGSGICFALGIISMRGEREGSPLTIVLLGNAITVLVCMPVLVNTSPAVNDLLLLIPLGVLQLGLGYILFVRGIRHVTAIEGTLVPMIEPILNPLWVALFQGERPQPLALIGGAIVVATVTGRGVVVAMRRRRGG